MRILSRAAEGAFYLAGAAFILGGVYMAVGISEADLAVLDAHYHTDVSNTHERIGGVLGVMGVLALLSGRLTKAIRKMDEVVDRVGKRIEDL